MAHEDWSPLRRRWYLLAKKNYDKKLECCGPMKEAEYEFGYFSHPLKIFKEFEGWAITSMAHPVSLPLRFCPWCGIIIDKKLEKNTS